MLYAVCCMLYAVCCMLYAVCCMLYAVCCMLYVLHRASCSILPSNVGVPARNEMKQQARLDRKEPKLLSINV
jgi:hypothetical protein